MNCPKCGNIIPEDSRFCPACGTVLKTDETPVTQIPPIDETNAEPAQGGFAAAVADRFASAFRDRLFLAMCVLISVSFGVGLIGGSFDVLTLLLVIFTWQIYSSAQKGIAHVKSMRNVSGVVFARHVIDWIAIGALALLGVLLIAVRGYGEELCQSFLYTPEWNRIVESGALADPKALEDLLAQLGQIGADLLCLIVGITLLLVSAVAALFNQLAIHRFHRLAQSMYKSVQNGFEELANVRAARGWLLAFGIFQGISALSGVGNLLGFLSAGSMAATYVLAYLWVDRHFVKGLY